MLRLIVASVAAVACTNPSPFVVLIELVEGSPVGKAAKKDAAIAALKALEPAHGPFPQYIEVRKALLGELVVADFPLQAQNEALTKKVATFVELANKFHEATKKVDLKKLIKLLEALDKALEDAGVDAIAVKAQMTNLTSEVQKRRLDKDAEFVKVRDFVKHVSTPNVKITNELASVLFGLDLIVTDMTTLAEEDERTGEDVASAKNVEKLSSDIKKLLKKERNLTVMLVILGVIGALAVDAFYFYFYKKRQ